MKKILFLIFLITLGVSQLGLAYTKSTNNAFSKPAVQGLKTRMNINNIDLALQNNGQYGLEADTYFPTGSGLSFLYEGGLGLSGYDSQGNLRLGWVMGASRKYNFQPGTWGMDPDDPKAKFYIVTKDDGPNSDAYVEWADAVALGASYVDVDNNGQYDPAVDKPDLLGDKTIWTVYNDGAPPQGEAEFPDRVQLGVEVYQSVFAFARSDDLGNVIFIRYRIKNVGTDDLSRMIFSVINDPDLGDYNDDLIGCDTTLSMGFIYNPGKDAVYGDNPPAYGVDFFQGPLVDSPGDTAIRVLGPDLGVEILPDKKNLPMSSFMYYINNDNIIGDPDLAVEARRYMEGGLEQDGDPIDPLTFPYGVGASATDNPKYIYSGDPVTGGGWLDAIPSDKRFLINCGEFELPVGSEQDVVIGMVVGQGTDALSSVTEMKKIDEFAQYAYNANFILPTAPPVPDFTINERGGKIIIDVDLQKLWDYRSANAGAGFDFTWEGLALYQYLSPTPSEYVNNIQNKKLIGIYDVENGVKKIFLRDGKFEVKELYTLKDNIVPGQKHLVIEVDADAFADGAPLVEGKEYYYGIEAFAVDRNNIVQLSGSFYEVDKFTYLGSAVKDGFFTVVMGKDVLNTADYANSADPRGVITINNFTTGDVEVEVVDPTAVKQTKYTLSFNEDAQGKYYVIIDQATNDTVFGPEYNIPTIDKKDEATNFASFDGLVVKVFDDNRIGFAEINQSEGNPEDVYFEWYVLDHAMNYAGGSYAGDPSTFVPLRLLFDTERKYVAHALFWAPGYAYEQDTIHTYVAGYDISDPDNPRQVNVLIRDGGTTRDLDMDGTAFERCFVTPTDYTEDPNFYPVDYVSDGELTFFPLLLDGHQIMEAKVAFDFLPYAGLSGDIEIDATKLDLTLTNEEKKALVDKINVVPNPYWAYSQYETSYDTPQVKFTNIPGKATIRIFTLAGQLVNTLEKTDTNTPFITWDLRNSAGLKVASGMYIIHVDVEGVGSKVLKFALIQREERIDAY